MLLNCGVEEDSWDSLGLQGDPTSPSWRRSVLNVHWEDWWWSWNSNTFATWFKELTHLKRPWCWERLMAGGEGYNRGWDGWMASLTQWTWVWVNSGSWWWTGRPGMLHPWVRRVVHAWVTKLKLMHTYTHTKIFDFYWNSSFTESSTFHPDTLTTGPGPGTQCAHRRSHTYCCLIDLGVGHVIFLGQMNGNGCDTHHF